MNKRGGMGLTMSQRVATGRPGDPEVVSPVEACPGRHCWVLDPADRSRVRRPGLLLEWRRAAPGVWEGRVVYAASLRPGEWLMLQEWIPAALVEPATSTGD